MFFEAVQIDLLRALKQVRALVNTYPSRILKSLGPESYFFLYFKGKEFWIHYSTKDFDFKYMVPVISGEVSFHYKAPVLVLGDLISNLKNHGFPGHSLLTISCKDSGNLEILTKVPFILSCDQAQMNDFGWLFTEKSSPDFCLETNFIPFKSGLSGAYLDSKTRSIRFKKNWVQKKSEMSKSEAILWTSENPDVSSQIRNEALLKFHEGQLSVSPFDASQEWGLGTFHLLQGEVLESLQIHLGFLLSAILHSPCESLTVTFNRPFVLFQYGFSQYKVKVS